jgi:hypothetical protein
VTAAAVPARVAASEPADLLALAILYTPLVAVTFLAKFAVVIGDTELLIGIPLILAATCVGIFSRRLKLEPGRITLYLAMVAILVAEQVFAVKQFQPTSLLLLIAVHAAYVFRIDMAGDPANHLNRFLNIITFICIAGIIQYAAQFAVGIRYAFPIEHFVPRSIVSHAYHSLNPLHYGSKTLKSNGVFLLEPSYLSQFLATGFVLEAAGPQRIWRLICFCAGFVVAFSGTGLIMLAVTLPTLLIAYRRYSLLVFLIMTGIALAMVSEFVGLDLFVKRANEFQTTGSSGYMRYVGPVLLFDQYLWSEPQRWLFGVGSGMMMRTTPMSIYHVSETGWAKIILEFGLVGAAAYFGFLYTCIFRSTQPIVLRVSLAAMTLMSGILDAPPHGLILSLLLWPAAQKSAARTEPDAAQPRAYHTAPPASARWSNCST